MTTCGYVCPVCEGKGYTDNLAECDNCIINDEATLTKEIKDDKPTEKV